MRVSIQTDLTRIKNAKAAIKAAIKGKGVTVPDGTLLDGMAALISGIEAGESFPVDFRTGTFTFTENTTESFSVKVDGSYAFIKDIRYAVFYEVSDFEFNQYPKLKFGMAAFTSSDKNTSINVLYGYTSSNYKKPMYDLSRTQIKLTKSFSEYGTLTITPDSEVPFHAGTVYRWILFGYG